MDDNDLKPVLTELRDIKEHLAKIRLYLFGLFVFLVLAYGFARLKGYF